MTLLIFVDNAVVANLVGVADIVVGVDTHDAINVADFCWFFADVADLAAVVDTLDSIADPADFCW